MQAADGQARPARRRSRRGRRPPSSRAAARSRPAPRGPPRARPPAAPASRRAARRSPRRRPPRPGRRSARRRPPAAPAASWRETSSIPEWPAETGSAPQAAASTATIPNASGKVLGMTSASASGSSSATSSCSSRPMNSTEPAMPLRRLGVAGGRVGEERGEDRQRLLLPALEPAAQPRDLARVVEVAAVERSQQAAQPVLVLAEAGDLRARASGCAARTSGQAASSRSTPLETISLPTKTTRGWRGRGLRGPRAEPSGPRRPRGRKPPCRRRAGRAGSSPPGPATSGSAAQSDSAVWREPTRTPAAASHALLRVGQEARVRLDRVLERRAVDLGGEGADLGAGEDRRAHHQVVGERQRRSRRPPRRPRAPRRRWRRCSGRARRRSARGRP